MTYPHGYNQRDDAALPTSPSDLGPEHPILFHPMHEATAAAALRAGRLLSTRDIVLLEPSRVIRERAKALARLNANMPAPWFGKVGDACSLTWTPHTPTVLASCGRKPLTDAVAISCGALVIAIVRFDILAAMQLPHLYSDRYPAWTSARITEVPDLTALPWGRFRRHEFAGSGLSSEEAGRYGAEVLVWGGVPLASVSAFAVVDADAAERLREQTSRLGCEGAVAVAIRPEFFFETRSASSWGNDQRRP